VVICWTCDHHVVGSKRAYLFPVALQVVKAGLLCTTVSSARHPSRVG